MGVWIEMVVHKRKFRLDNVTPLVGVWIEITNGYYDPHGRRVTPLVGVWIEIIVNKMSGVSDVGHSPRGSVD